MKHLSPSRWPPSRPSPTSPSRRMALLVAAAWLAPAALAQPAGTDGEVVKVDKAAGRVTLKHNGISSLDMPPMTLAFRVNDNKLLDTLAVGDKVRFSADKVGGSYTLTSIVKVP